MVLGEGDIQWKQQLTLKKEEELFKVRIFYVRSDNFF